MGDLFVRTTAAIDLVQITRNPTPLNPNQVRLRISASMGNYSVSNKTIVYGGGASDTVMQGDLTIPAELYGEAGDDALIGGSADDRLDGGAGNDWLAGGLGNDRIDAGLGNNVLWGDNSPTITDPEPQQAPLGGDDTLSGLDGDDVFYGGGGNDQVSAGAGNDYAHGGEGDDVVVGSAGDDRLYGGAGNDLLTGDAGNDLLAGNAGDDTLSGNSGNDVLVGGIGLDLINGDAGNDLLVGGSVVNENSSRTSLLAVGNVSATTYSNPADNDAALLRLLFAWGSVSDRTPIGAIRHDGLNDDLIGGEQDDDFCWEMVDISDDPPYHAPSDFNAIGQGADERFEPT
jgi:fibronectin-binding autotransporter adhesin